MSTHRPDVTIMPFNGKTPQIHESAFIAPGCRIIGDVTIGEQASIWYNCVIRGDANRVVIGARTNIQDGSVVHCDHASPHAPNGFPAIVGDDVLIGHMAMVHGCVIQNNGFVGLGAIVMNGCTIESHGMLGAGALLPEGKTISERELWVGRPAKMVRTLDDAALAIIGLGIPGYVENAKAHKKAIAEHFSDAG